jgi:hypothetical protein
VARWRKFLGTGSVVGDGSILLTADHVITDWTAGPLAIMNQHDASNVYRIAVIERDRRHGLALLRIAGYRAPRPLPVMFDRHVSGSRELITYEFGADRRRGR